MNITDCNSNYTENTHYKMIQIKSYLTDRTAFIAKLIFLYIGAYNLYHENYGLSILSFCFAEVLGEIQATAQNYAKNPKINFDEASGNTIVIKRVYNKIQKAYI